MARPSCQPWETPTMRFLSTLLIPRTDNASSTWPIPTGSTPIAFSSGLLPDENAIGVDPVGIGQVLDALSVRGINNVDKKRIVGVSQGWQLGRAIKTLERHLADGSFVHGAQPL